MRIIGTVGPSTKENSVLKDLILEGVDTFRFNFSHGDRNDFKSIHKYLKKLDMEVSVMADLSGTKIRISEKLKYIYKVYNGEEVIFCGEDKYVDRGYTYKKNTLKLIPLNISSQFINEKEFKSISMKDNTMNFEIIKFTNEGVKVRVTRGGIVRATKGCNIIGYKRGEGILSTRDIEGIDFVIKNNIEIICQSFVESENDIIAIKDYIKSKTDKKFIIWAKIETEKGIENIEKILKQVDGIVIGRGDLVSEAGIINTPIYQKQLIQKIKKIDENIEIIIGTHILNSMKCGRRAELSEVDSIYNLCNLGVSSYLLSGETSVGKAPINTVKFLKNILNKYSKEKE